MLAMANKSRYERTSRKREISIVCPDGFRRFIPLRLDDASIKGFLAQPLYIDVQQSILSGGDWCGSSLIDVD